MYEIVVIEVSRTKPAQRRVERKVGSNECLHVSREKGKPDIECVSPIHSLGLCEHHANSFNYEERSLATKAKKGAYRASLEQAGELLAPGELRRLRRQNSNSYTKAAAEVG